MSRERYKFREYLFLEIFHSPPSSQLDSKLFLVTEVIYGFDDTQQSSSGIVSLIPKVCSSNESQDRPGSWTPIL